MRMRQKTYPSDMSREQFEHVLPILEQARKRTKPRRVDVYEVWCAVLYLLRTGCQWRALPSDFPKWRTVHSYFAKWSECNDEGVSLLEHRLKKSGWRGPRQTGAQRCTRFLIVDAQSVKNTDTAGQKGYDAGKKVSGIKRHIAVDTQGLPHAIAVTTAEVTDRKGTLQALERCQSNLTHVQSLLCDSGYTGVRFPDGAREILGEQLTVQIAKRSELHTFKVMPKRWIVERSFAWLEKNRRLWKNCERKLNTSLQFIHLAFLALLLRRS
uniref:Putative transposase n=5 Tax=Xanthomonas TaxID=338 RepID=Q9Z3F3_XANCE|nr:putative transposase [Xanthomonas campestris pv. campestris]